MKTPTAALQLGFAGLAPFAALAALAWVGPAETLRPALIGLALYGGLILSFMGGCRWGFAAAGLGQGPRFAPLLLSTLPALWAFAALGAALLADDLTALQAACAALMIGFIALWASDRRAARTGDAPGWWTALRTPLTAGACAALGLGAAAAL